MRRDASEASGRQRQVSHDGTRAGPQDARRHARRHEYTCYSPAEANADSDTLAEHDSAGGPFERADGMVSSLQTRATRTALPDRSTAEQQRGRLASGAQMGPAWRPNDRPLSGHTVRHESLGACAAGAHLISELLQSHLAHALRLLRRDGSGRSICTCPGEHHARAGPSGDCEGCAEREGHAA